MDPDRTCRSVRAREAEAKELLCELIRIPSLPGCEQPAVTLLRDWLADRSVPVRLVEIDDAIKDDPDYSFGDEPFEYAGRHNLVAELGGASGRGLIVSTHLDVVPAGGWDGAFAPREECGEIIGRGACDAKGQVVAAAVALAALADAGAGLDGRVSAHFVVEEEVGGNGALALLAGAEGAEGGEGADGALVMEPTGFNVHPANRGALWFRLAVTGRASHMGRRHEGVNAIEKMVPLIAGLRRYEEQLLEESRGVELFEGYEHPVQLCLGMLRAGSHPSTVPEGAVLEGGVGFLPNRSMDAVKAELRRAIEAAADEWTASHFTLDFPKLHNDAYCTDPVHPLVGEAVAAARECGIEPEVSGWNVSCDARLYHHRGGLPTVVFGPGRIERAHSAGEGISVSDLLGGAEAVARLITRWCGA